MSRPQLDFSALRRFLEDEGQTWEQTPNARDPENLVEMAGRLCYMSFGARQFRKPNAVYLANLIEQGHESVLEHASWSFILTGVSRAFTHQMVRHRIGFSFSQLSQQYHEETAAQFIEPSAIAALQSLSEIWHKSVLNSRDAYVALLRALEDEPIGIPAEQKREIQRAVRTAARSVLPNATETKMLFTANARAIRSFLEIRGSIEGDEEMRLVSALLLERMQEEARALFDDFVIDHLPNGSPIVRRVR